MTSDKPKSRRIAVYLDAETEKAIRRRAEDADLTVSRVAADLIRSAANTAQDGAWTPLVEAAPVWDTPAPAGRFERLDDDADEAPEDLVGPPAWLAPGDPDELQAWRRELQAQLKALLARYPAQFGVLEAAAGLWDERGLQELLASVVVWRQTLDHTPDADPRAEATWWTQGAAVAIRELEALTHTRTENHR